MENALVVCYSYSGNTYRVAREISEQIEGDFFEIYPKQPYSMAFSSLLKQVREEIRLGVLPQLFPMPVDMAEYSTIFIGTPNWCGTIAPPVVSWLKKQNLKGKVLVPFYTHCGGDKGNIEAKLRMLCPEAEVRTAICITNDGGDRLSTKISNWLETCKWKETAELAS